MGGLAIRRPMKASDFGPCTTMDATPLLDIRSSDRRIVAGGSWTAAHAATLERLIDKVARDAPAGAMDVDVAGVGELDTYGAWLLERLVRSAQERGRTARLISVPERF